MLQQLSEDLEGPFAAVLEAARRVGKVATDSKLTLDLEEYVSSFRPDLFEAMTAWYRGVKFADVWKMTDLFEVGGVKHA